MKRLVISIGLLLLVSDAYAKAKRPVRRARAMEIRKKSLAAKELRSPVFNNAPRGGNDIERQLQSSLDGILAGKWLKAAVNGVYVTEVATGRVLYAYGEDRQLNPASNTKLVSTATALDALGADFRYATRILGPAPDDEGVVDGDVYLVGARDPTLGTKGLADLASSLAAAGVRRVNGDVVVGDAERDAVARPVITVTITGDDEEGELADVTISPDSGYLVIDTSAETIAKKGNLDVTLHAEMNDGEPTVVVSVTGRIHPGQVVQAVRAVPNAALFTGHTFRAMAMAEGVTMVGGVKQASGQPADAATLSELAVHQSVPLRRLAALINKPSNNFLADRLIAKVGSELFGGTPTLAKGVQAMSSWLQRIGIAPGSYRFDNGSGLSHAIHISARQVVKVLLAGAQLGTDWVESLSVAGQDGTLRWRFARRPSAGHVQAKTGTLSGVSTLSGFVTVGDEQLCFAILTNGFRHKRKNQVKDSQADAVDAMYRYLVAKSGAAPAPRRVEPEAAPPPPVPADSVPPEEDIETHEGEGPTEPVEEQ